MEEIKIILESFNLMKWYGLALQTFPRNYRYGLGLRIENALYDLHKLLIEAKFTSDKSLLLKKANIEVEFIRFLVREVYELKLIDSKRHHSFISQIESIGKQLGGWIKSLD
ncbi:MAG: diversity-generating retroelement protein Avd [Candidatus Cloacimonetes bacterium]|nr:diversity-generating retroelement protein Avd [Candidatus Cloacimonadota bacterium]